MFKIELGLKVKSEITGFEGVVVSRSECLHGCNRYFIQPSVKEDGTLPDGIWADEAEFVVVSEKKLERKNNECGGPCSKVK